MSLANKNWKQYNLFPIFKILTMFLIESNILNMLKKILFWVLAVILTLVASVYQKETGPTNEKRLEVLIDGTSYQCKLPRSGNEVDKAVVLKGFPAETKAFLFWKKYPTADAFTKVEMITGDEGLTAVLPVQPHAGKLEYYVEINGTTYFEAEPLIIRFKGAVPAWALIPHILLMFIAMLTGSYAFLQALSNDEVYKKYIFITLGILIVGGFIFGPIVQYFAFDTPWAGIPFGTDLTDNKTLIALVALILSAITSKKKWNRWIAISSIIVLFAVFSIPHSFRGSELNYETGTVVTSQTD